jgi:SAM-dependent methyltransferase
MPPLNSPDAAFTSAPECAEFIGRVTAALVRDEFVQVVLAKPTAEPELQNLKIRRVLLRGEVQLSLIHHYRTRDTAHNVSIADGTRLIDDALRGRFRQAVLQTRVDEATLLIGKRGRHKLLVRKLPAEAQLPSLEHDRAKKRWLTLDRPFLAALGVTDAQQRLVPVMARKWRQINKFIEVFDAAWRSAGLSTDAAVQIVDFGSGKGYLTFAIHDYLRNGLRMPVQVTGVELRADMVELCSAVVTRLGLQGLHFEQGDVRDERSDALDVMIALHACDTATDHAIHLGVRAGARIIMCAPCCHKEVRPQLLSPQPLRAILQHGVHLGQEAEMVTDGLRALLLEACGYATQVFEFVSLEHTSKNKMILAVKRPGAQAPEPVLEQVAEVKRFYGIREQCLERLLRERWARAPS